MDKYKFENDILAVLLQYGYKIDGVQKLQILMHNTDDLPKINIEYLYTDTKKE